MRFSKTVCNAAALLVLFGGFGYLIVTGRPTQKTMSPLTPQANAAATDQTSSTTSGYTLAQVQTHAAQNDCWTTIEGSVYDLTSWISRHPGGPDAIIGLCGNNGTDAFIQQHGNSRRAKAALVLLKIGDLQK